ncbi:hypothetical protein WJX72_009165 [[Myrmecia] bisecta]|uniref:Peptidase M50 domain-containing protein n=1 Tax=[Myrmecia] bisecta TaxID=41462 RepID=A0AAW1R8Y9_9CHLO
MCCWHTTTTKRSARHGHQQTLAARWPSQSPHLGRQPKLLRATEDDRPPAEERSEQPEASTSEPVNLQLPPAVVSRLRDTVFGIDSFFVTSVENYQANGVLFKGNLRGKDPAKAYSIIARRLKEQLGSDYSLFLLEDQESKPVAVVIPTSAVEEPVAALPEGLLAVLFALAATLTTLNANGVSFLQPDQLDLSTASLLAAAPGTAAFFLLLVAHEVGHRYAAQKRGVQLSLPFFIPAGLGLLGSFGAITRFKGTLPNREVLLEVAAYGPLFGAAASALCVVVGLALSSAGIGGVPVEPQAFQDSFVLGLLGEAFLGGKLATQQTVSLSPLLLAGWAGLIANALNAIPVGELDGGRIAHGLWGRRAAGRISTVTLLLLGICGVFDTVALYWLLLVLFLQRGPIVPQQEELSPPAEGLKPLGIALLFLPLLILLPFPFSVAPSFDQF